MESVSITLALSSCGSTRAFVPDGVGTICGATGYIRSDTRCAVGGSFLIAVRRMMLDARCHAVNAKGLAGPRATILAHEVGRLATDFAVTLTASRSESDVWKSVDGMLHSFFLWLCTLSVTERIPATRDEALALMDRFIAIHRSGV